MEIRLKQGGCRAGSSWGRGRRSARLTSSVTPTSGNLRGAVRLLFRHTASTISVAETALRGREQMQSPVVDNSPYHDGMAR